jgi:hypothetical protein
MNCKIPWNNEFIIANFTKKFFNEDLAMHRANVQFENEKALMPETQQRIERMNAITEMNGLRTMADMYTRLKRAGDAARYHQMANEIVATYGITDSGPSTPSTVKPRAVCGCIRDECRGFIMSNTWKCGMCAVRVCSECLKEAYDGHECTQEDKDTRKLLLKDTKPCPKCAAMIYKTEGCSQMWCTMCHTTFDWRTGEIVTGYVHNPHYFEWARRNGHEIARAPGDVPPGQCDGDGLPDANAFIVNIRALYRENPANVRMLTNLYQTTAHMNEVMRNWLRVDNGADQRETLRMRYLQDEISVDEFKKALINIHRTRERKEAIWQVAELFIAQSTEVLRFMYRERRNISRSAELKVLTELIDYCNENFKKIAKAYNQSKWFRIDTSRGTCIYTAIP